MKRLLVMTLMVANLVWLVPVCAAAGKAGCDPDSQASAPGDAVIMGCNNNSTKASAKLKSQSGSKHSDKKVLATGKH